ncbi:hypothetical protein OS493_026115, partial [Desmophyllum pertusum]
CHIAIKNAGISKERKGKENTTREDTERRTKVRQIVSFESGEKYGNTKIRFNITNEMHSQTTSREFAAYQLKFEYSPRFICIYFSEQASMLDKFPRE